MDRHTIIFTTDDRQRNLGKLLCGKKVSCSWDEYEQEYKEKEKVERVFVLPTPVSKLDSYVAIAEKLKQELISDDSQLRIFGGAFTPSWKSFLEEQAISYIDFMCLEDVVDGNALITAEAVVAEVLQLSPYSLAGQTILITGYGRCAQPIAQKLSVLGAKVVIAARSKKAREAAVQKGYIACDIPQLVEFVPACHTIINTIPAMVLTKELIGKMHEGTRILDIASKPGGTDFEVAEELGIKAKLALGLPGIYSTRSSAALLEKAMLQYAPLQQLERGEQSWIFQIAI